MTAPTERGVYSGVPEAVYHGDPNSISSSQGRRLLEITPAEWKWEQDHPAARVPTESQELGTAVHTEVLGVGAPYVVVDAPNWKKPADQVRRKTIRARGEVPLLPPQAEMVRTMAANVRNDPDAGPLFASGAPELSGYAPDPKTGVMLRARTDWLREVGRGRRVGVDLKTAESADPGEFGVEAARWGYHVQQPWYEDVFELAELPLSAWLWVVVSKRPPHLVTVCELSARAVDLGRSIARDAIDLYARCRDTNTWPGHGRGIHQIDLPAWEYKKQEYARS
ncbi:PD-(D/E)XK nuclease-like domain-containing protein [Nocardia sp. NBC_01009]|uniref:PD-(D/E)XK nuclease-like domain-containing protein n=1 Tax=Nocardia sp. NBC_01009 TaxID=2975996 RepID=UPI00386C13A0|nr:PD-(D/E)XK nuclease-like domain-containing protein [Nocardia sp. NBC_01009]